MFFKSDDKKIIFYNHKAFVVSFNQNKKIKEEDIMKNWKMQMKKATSLLLAGVMVLSLAACGSKGSDGKSDKEDEKPDKKTEQEGQDFTKDVWKDRAVKDDGTPIKAAITVAELDSE